MIMGTCSNLEISSAMVLFSLDFFLNKIESSALFFEGESSASWVVTTEKEGEWEGAQLGQIRCKKGEKTSPVGPDSVQGREKRPQCQGGGLSERNWLGYAGFGPHERNEEKRTYYFV